MKQRRASYNAPVVVGVEDEEEKKGLSRRHSFASGDEPKIPVRRQSSFSQQRRGSRASSLEFDLGSVANAAAVVAASSVLAMSEEEKERNIVNATAERRRRNKGRSIDSVLMSPRRVGGEAAAERGPSLITHHIALGGRDDANNHDCLVKLGVSHILNVANSLPNSFADSYIYLNFGLHDTEDEQIIDVMEKASAFIKHVEEIDGRVLIHCVSGVSRSVTVAILHLIMEHKMLLKDAYNYITSCRPFIAPNDGFKLQMAEAELKHLRFSSVCGPDAGKSWEFYEWNMRKQKLREKQEAQGASAPKRKQKLSHERGGDDCCVCS